MWAHQCLKTMGRAVLTQGVRYTPATSWVQVVVAVSVLVIGALVYVLDRPTGAVPFFTTVSLDGQLPSVFGTIGNSLPTFAHVFALSVLTAAWLGRKKCAGLSACLFWFGLDTAFEVGQHPQVAQRIVQFMPSWFERLPLLEQADTYFLAGTFDTWDLISIAAGAAAAYLAIVCTTPKDRYRG
jgi:hypothetical protein